MGLAPSGILKEIKYTSLSSLDLFIAILVVFFINHHFVTTFPTYSFDLFFRLLPAEVACSQRGSLLVFCGSVVCAHKIYFLTPVEEIIIGHVVANVIMRWVKFIISTQVTFINMNFC